MPVNFCCRFDRRIRATTQCALCSRANRRHSGATLIEVLVAALVGSIGLLGAAALMVHTAKANLFALENVQAGIAAQSLIDAMHVNPLAIATHAYDGSFGASDAAGPDCARQPCSTAQRAGYDCARFKRTIAATLPNATANLKCDVGAAAAETTCRLEVDWSGQAVASPAGQGSQSQVWIFAP
jgi:type IV pilus assembly protein PilV